jgi:hypothetical protein
MSKGSKKREYIIEFLAVAIVLFAAVTIVSYFGGFTGVPPAAFEKIEIGGAKANELLVIIVNYNNTGNKDANLTNILINSRPVSSYVTFVDVYDSSGSSIKNLLNRTGYFIPVGKDGEFTIMFSKDTFASGQVLNISIQTERGNNYTTTCRVP